jgi:hypothetical protein
MNGVSLSVTGLIGDAVMNKIAEGWRGLSQFGCNTVRVAGKSSTLLHVGLPSRIRILVQVTRFDFVQGVANL